MINKAPYSQFENLSDVELINQLLVNDEIHSCIYLKHKEYCIRFMKSKGVEDYDAEDIYQDATIVLYEKIKEGTFVLTSKIQTYLTSICWYQVLARGKNKQNKLTVNTDDIDENAQDWFEEDDELKNERIQSILKAMRKMKNNSDKCYQGLKLFYYEKLSMEQIAAKVNWGGADSAKSQISKCRNAIKVILRIKG